MTVIENSLYANLYVETSPVQATAAWTNHIGTVRNISLSRGGYEDYVGVTNMETGSGTITLVNNSATIQPGYWVRVGYSSTNVWAGFIQDVNTTFTFIEGITYEVKTLVVLDWVAWISQYSTPSLASANRLKDRAIQLNLLVDSTGANKPLVERFESPSVIPYYGSINEQKSLAEILDLTVNSTPYGYWKATTTAPTGSTSGIDSILDMYTTNLTPAVDVAFTDGTHTGSPTNLTYYADVEMAKQTSSVSNNVVVTNIFGYGTDQLSTTYQLSDATSIATYGSRLGQFETNRYFGDSNFTINLSTWPSFEGRDYSGTSANFFTSVEEPSRDLGGAWSAYSGTRALRAYNTAGTGTNTTQGNDERINVTAGTTYYMIAYGATTGTTSIRARSRIDWYSEANALISTTFGSFVSLTSVKTWYKTTTSGAAPATAVFARATVYFDRGGTSTFPITTKLWVDGVYFGVTNLTDWFDGNTTDTSSFIYDWLGAVDSSQSFKATNSLDSVATDFLNANKTPQYSPKRFRFNAQALLTAATSVDLYKTVYFWLESHRWTSLVTGINHNITINENGTTRWMVDVIVRPSTYTI